MISLCAAAAFFVGIHFGVSGTRLRDRLVARLGELPYQGLFSLASVVGLAWLWLAYRGAGHVPLWGQLHALRAPALVTVFASLLLVVVGVTTPNPTAAGFEARLAGGDAARGILRVTRHPFLWGIALWAATHLVLNGDQGSLVFFGSLLLLALGGPLSIDRKRERHFGESWQRFAALTSNVPFAAIAGGRNRLRLAEIGWWRPLLAAAVYALLLAVHARAFGASPLPL